MKNFLILAAVCGTGILCGTQISTGEEADNALKSHAYWKQGGAEISVYELSQNRYRENHQGQVVTIVVKEDFLYEKQVKNESYTDSKSTPVLKRIELRKFPTGVYDYSTFSSVFTPINRDAFSKSFKLTSSIQEWCGTTFMQFNLKNGKYVGQLNSYFESEGDRKLKLGKAVIEEELYTMLRMNPQLLPLGEFQLIPSSVVLRMQHLETRSYLSKATLTAYDGDTFKGENLQQYLVEQPEMKRSLAIVFEKEAPYKVVGWTDTYPSIFDKKLRTTVVKLKTQRHMEYWNQSQLKDQKLRKELGIRF